MRLRVAVLSALVLGAMLFIPLTVLQVCTPAGKILWQRPLPLTGQFELHYTHSWDKTPVEEVFAADEDGRLMLIKERYSWMGAGLDPHPSALLDFSQEMVVAQAAKRIGVLHLAVGTVTDQRLLFGHQEVALTQLAQPGTKLTLQLNKTSVAAVLSGLIP
ncbi:MAG TPA: DUF1850 domain-containing protein [bacterium]|jgi:hypothetical protein|nr:DUF1850 domain-containing protein [bacterium]